MAHNGSIPIILAQLKPLGVGLGTGVDFEAGRIEQAGAAAFHRHQRTKPNAFRPSAARLVEQR